MYQRFNVTHRDDLQTIIYTIYPWGRMLSKSLLCLPAKVKWHVLKTHATTHGRRLLGTRATSDDVFALHGDRIEEPISSAYIHLPFCKKKCLYCDFPVVALGSTVGQSNSKDDPMMDAYVDALCREITLMSIGNTRNRQDDMEDHGVKLKTVYFGGGTPSLISLKSLERILDVLEDKIGIAPDAEITMEADPGTFTTETLKSYINMGVQRVSVGVQAFDDELLKLCGRSHSLYDVYDAIDAIYSASVPSWSLDLISGLPELTMERWEKNLMCAVDAEPKHLSSYDLQVEQGTPFGKMYRPGVSPLPTDEEAAQMYSQASYILRGAGYDHYELSSYAKPGHQCKHNAVYWDGQGYYAFGMGASSYIDTRRVTRPRTFNAYLGWVEKFSEKVEQGIVPLPHLDAPPATQEDILTDAIMLQLRKSSGLDLQSIKRTYRYGSGIVDAILDIADTHRERGLVEYDDGYLKLVDPQGFLFSNDVISDIFLGLDRIKDDI